MWGRERGPWGRRQDLASKSRVTKVGVLQEGEIGSISQAVGEKGGTAGGGTVGKSGEWASSGVDPSTGAEWVQEERVGTKLRLERTPTLA